MTGLRKVLVSPELVANVLRQGNEIRARFSKGLPAGARLVHVGEFHGGLGGDIELVFEHESFATTPGGAVLVLTPQAEQL